MAELNRLRRVTPKLVAEILKFPDVDRRLSSKFFHWAGMQETIFEVVGLGFMCVIMFLVNETNIVYGDWRNVIVPVENRSCTLQLTDIGARSTACVICFRNEYTASVERKYE